MNRYNSTIKVNPDYRIPKISKKKAEQQERVKNAALIGNKPRKRINPVSKKRAEQMKVYSVMLKAWKEGKVCVICGSPNIDAHHPEGRSGERLLDFDNMVPLCRPHHTAVELNPVWAKQNGYSKDRLTK